MAKIEKLEFEITFSSPSDENSDTMILRTKVNGHGYLETWSGPIYLAREIIELMSHMRYRSENILYEPT